MIPKQLSVPNAVDMVSLRLDETSAAKLNAIAHQTAQNLIFQ